MGSSSKKQGNQPVMPAKAAAPAAPLHGDPLTWDANGNVKTWKPAPAPLEVAQSDPRQMLAFMQARGMQNSPSDSRLGYPRDRMRSSGDRGGQHASGGRGFGGNRGGGGLY
jgi:hypothetical protein